MASGNDRVQARFEKRWNPLFENRRDEIFSESEPWVQVKRAIDSYHAGDDLDDFLSDWNSPVPSCSVEEIKRFCQSASSSPSLSSAGLNLPRKARAWLHDLDYNTGYCRKYPGRLGAVELAECLKKPRSGVWACPKADRRLCYIPDIDPDFVRVLAASATPTEVALLRDTIWKHIAFQASIGVQIPPRGYPIFRLEFHVPYYALRESRPEFHNGLSKQNSAGGLRGWTDLSFLRIPSQLGQNDCKYGIHEAHISLCIYGKDRTRWSAFAFVDTSFNNVSKDDQADEDDDQDDLDEYNEDPIASDGDGDEVPVDRPIWCPREYFLRNVDCRARQVLEEWRNLIRKVGKGVDVHRTQYPFQLAPTSSTIQHRDVKEAFDWIVKTIELLGQLQGCFTGMIRAWERFNAQGGDVKYFSDLPHAHARLHLDNIKETFEEFKSLEYRLNSLEKSCQRRYEILGLRMTFASNQIDLKSHELNHESLRLGYETSKLNTENHRITLETNQVALANHRTAQLALSMNQIWTPLGIAVAYFGGQQEIFQLGYKPKSFILAFFAMIFGVRIAVTSMIMLSQTRIVKRAHACITHQLARFSAGSGPPDLLDSASYRAAPAQV
ncbi:hypothetical protein EJ04DRAFT_559065 [Polyplosphaeria fusca]|uniref:Uncharacterized protein n=1 Tax=Polyplosphaeria fusca TaxID=682080 RepID=A0A9P4RBM9_9PLEO|nr:hypothetical protein EJ04DRAFT_559065 [Polyplosphaeria fusca]